LSLPVPWSWGILDLSFFSFEVDPQHVLGVSPGASLEQIRDAYRQKAKRFHPDAGGEDWAFRIVVQAYEMLSRARVARAARAEQTPQQPAASPRPKADHQSGSFRVGIHDRNVPPANIVALELLCVRFLWDEADYLWITQRAPDEERFLSCNVNFSWPDSAATGLLPPDLDPAPRIAALQDTFDQMIITTRVVSSRSRSADDRFDGWLSYSNFDRAWKAVNSFHQLLLSRGLGLRQWSRDLFVPRSDR
jgi:hypothetical protein